MARDMPSVVTDVKLDMAIKEEKAENELAQRMPSNDSSEGVYLRYDTDKISFCTSEALMVISEWLP